jgi:DNA-binding XRE family transcriptional regulator
MDTKTWLDSKVIICPTSEITEQYAHIAIAHKKRLPALAQPGEPISEQFKRTRADRGLTYEKAAEQIGVSVGTLSNIENGSNPRPKTAEKIKQWIAA